MFEQRKQPVDVADSRKPAQPPSFNPFVSSAPVLTPEQLAVQRAEMVQQMQARHAASQAQWNAQAPQRLQQQQALEAQHAEQVRQAAEATRQQERAAYQRQVASAFVGISVSNLFAQRQAVGPVLQAAELGRQEQAELQQQQATVQRALAGLSHLSPDALELAMQRRAQDSLGPVPTRPQSLGDWVTVMRHRAAQVEGQSLDARSVATFTGLQRQVAQTLNQAFRQDRQSADARYSEYAGHLVALQRTPLSAGVARVVMTLIPQSERPALQRAIDAQLEQEAIQRLQDEQAFDQAFLQRQAAELHTQSLQPIHERIQAKRGSGSPLPDDVRLHLEQGLNADLSRVRVHTDAEADQLSKSVHAIAFTSGQDIFFSAGSYQPNSKEGLELIAHEATHTKQQAQGQVGPGVDPDAGLEQEAQAMGKLIAQHVDQGGRAPMAPRTVQASTALASRVQAFSPAPPRTLRHALQRQLQPTVPGESIGKRAFVREEGLNLREQPDQHAHSLGTFPFGTQVLVSSRRGEWYQVLTAAGRSGYMLASKIYGLDARHQAMVLHDPGLRLFRVNPGETGRQLVKRAYGITGAEGAVTRTSGTS